MIKLAGVLLKIFEFMVKIKYVVPNESSRTVLSKRYGFIRNLVVNLLYLYKTFLKLLS